jgi:hypothetical protein
MKFGHRAEDHLTIHGDLSVTNRVMYQWAAGCYLHPALVDSSVKVVKLYNLVNHSDFDPSLVSISVNLRSAFLLTLLCQFFDDFTEGPNISGANIHVYKHKGVVLSSLENFNTGKRSGQAWPWVAPVDDIAVWTQSGIDGASFAGAPNMPSNTHLPDVTSNKNVALVTYRPGHNIALIPLLRNIVGPTSTRVALFFPEDRFDEIRKDRN